MNCPLCCSDKLDKDNIKTQEENGLSREMAVLKCRECGLIFAEDYKTDRSGIYKSDYAAWHKSKDDNSIQIAEAKKNTFQSQLGKLLKYVNPEQKKLLDVGTGNGYLLEVAEKMGFDCYGLDVSDYSTEVASQKFPGRIFKGTLEEGKYKTNYFDVVTMTDILEHLANPVSAVKEVDRILKPGGYLFIISPNSGSVTRFAFGKNWFQHKYEHTFYFNKKSLSCLLEKFGFDLVEFRNNIKKFSLTYYYYYFKKYSFLGIGKAFKFIYPIMPKFVKSFSFPNPITGEFLAVARKELKTAESKNEVNLV